MQILSSFIIVCLGFSKSTKTGHPVPLVRASLSRKSRAEDGDGDVSTGKGWKNVPMPTPCI